MFIFLRSRPQRFLLTLLCPALTVTNSLKWAGHIPSAPAQPQFSVWPWLLVWSRDYLCAEFQAKYPSFKLSWVLEDINTDFGLVRDEFERMFLALYPRSNETWTNRWENNWLWHVDFETSKHSHYEIPKLWSISIKILTWFLCLLKCSHPLNCICRVIFK